MKKPIVFKAAWPTPASGAAAFLALTLLAESSVIGAAFSPVALAPASFTQDIVVEKTAIKPKMPFAYTTAGMDNAGDTWIEKGFQPGFPLRGLPTAGTTFTSISAS